MALAAAQQDFRVNDRDGNKKQDYWRGPLSGLYLLKDPRGERVKLIEISLAGADVEAGPEVEEFVTRTPKAGYLFKALRFRGENPPDPDRFAACALPETKSAGKNMYIVSHQRILYQKPSQPGGIDVYPDDPIKEGWQKVPGR
jgi:hypothetical protein